jgi:hypothetical protein
MLEAKYCHKAQLTQTDPPNYALIVFTQIGTAPEVPGNPLDHSTV